MDIQGKRPFSWFFYFWIFQVLFDPLKKDEKERKKADFGRFPGRAARHQLNPHLLHPHLQQPKNLERDYLANPGIWGPFEFAEGDTSAEQNCPETLIKSKTQSETKVCLSPIFVLQLTAKSGCKTFHRRSPPPTFHEARNKLLFAKAQHQQLKKRVFSKGDVAEIAPHCAEAP